MMRLLHRFGRCGSGAAAIEFAIVSVLMVLMSFAVVDFGRGLYLRNKISYASDVASRKLLTDAATPNSVIDGTIRTAFGGPQAQQLQIVVASEAVGGVNYRRVRVVLPLALRVPGMTATVVDLSVTRRVPLL